MPAALSAARGINFIVSANDMATRTLSRTNMAVHQLGRGAKQSGLMVAGAFGGMIASTAALGAGMAGLGTMFGATKEATNFQFSMERVGIVTNATGEAFEGLRLEAQRLGLETEFTATQVADAMMLLAQAGFTSEQITNDLTSSVLDLTSASGELISTAEAAAAVSTAFKTFGGEGVKVRTLVDKMTRATQISRLQFQDLERGFAGVSGESRIFNQSFDTTLTLMTAARDVGFSAAAGANAIRISMRNLVGHAKDFEEITGRSIYNSKGELRDYIDVMEDLTKHWEMTGATQATMNEDIMKIFTKRGLRGVGVILKDMFVDRDSGKILKGIEATRARMEELRNSEGAAATAAERMRSTFLGTLRKIGGAIKNMAIIVGDTLVPMFAKVADRVFDASVKINNFLVSHKGLVKFGAVVVGLTSAFVALAGAVGFAASSIALYVAFMKMAGIYTAIVEGVTTLLTKAKKSSVIWTKLQTLHAKKLAVQEWRHTYAVAANYKATAAQNIARRNLIRVTKAYNVVLKQTIALELAAFGWLALILAVVAAGIGSYVAGMKLIQKGTKEGRVELVLLGKALKKFGTMIFWPMQIVMWIERFVKAAKEGAARGRAFMDFMAKPIQALKDSLHPVMVLMEGLGMLLENNFMITEDMFKRLQANDMLKTFVFIGSILKWFYNLSNAINTAIGKLGAFGNKLKEIWKQFAGEHFTNVFRVLGNMFTDTIKFATGQMSEERFHQRIRAMAETLAVSAKRALSQMMVKILEIPPEDWDRIAQSIAKGLLAVLYIFFKVLPQVMDSLKTAFKWILWELGRAVGRAFVDAIWNDRASFLAVFVKIAKYIADAFGMGGIIDVVFPDITSKLDRLYATQDAASQRRDYVEAKKQAELTGPADPISGQESAKNIAINLQMDGVEIARLLRGADGRLRQMRGGMPAPSRVGSGAQ